MVVAQACWFAVVVWTDVGGGWLDFFLRSLTAWWSSTYFALNTELQPHRLTTEGNGFVLIVLEEKKRTTTTSRVVHLVVVNERRLRHPGLGSLVWYLPV